MYNLAYMSVGQRNANVNTVYKANIIETIQIFSNPQHRNVSLCQFKLYKTNYF